MFYPQIWFLIFECDFLKYNLSIYKNKSYVVKHQRLKLIVN